MITPDQREEFNKWLAYINSSKQNNSDGIWLGYFVTLLADGEQLVQQLQAVFDAYTMGNKEDLVREMDKIGVMLKGYYPEDEGPEFPDGHDHEGFPGGDE